MPRKSEKQTLKEAFDDYIAAEEIVSLIFDTKPIPPRKPIVLRRDSLDDDFWLDDKAFWLNDEEFESDIPPRISREPLPQGPSFLDILKDVRQQLGSRRYWAPRTRNPNLTFIPWFDSITKPREFRSLFRMDRENFDILVDLISPNPVFHNSSPMQQTPVKYQLALFLFRLGRTSGGETHAKIGSFLGLGEGTVTKHSSRVLRAILDLRSTYIKWPDAEQRAAHKQQLSADSNSLFKDCVGMVDGTLIILRNSPASSHAINAMVVCTDRREIIYTRAGDFSTEHRSQVFARSRISTNPSEFFGPGEYVLANSAYTSSDTVITPFCMPRTEERDCEIFNTALSSERIAIERTIRQLKARFPMLTNIGFKTHNTSSHKAAIHWFESACVLHNFLLRQDEPEWNVQSDLQRARDNEKEVTRIRRQVERQRFDAALGADGHREWLLARMERS